MAERIIDISEYYPSTVEELKQFIKIAEAENPEIIQIWKESENVLNDQFIYTAGENGIKRWEKILKITPKGTDTFDDRRFIIISRLNEKLPYTFTILKNLLSNLCGENGFTAELIHNDYKLIVRIALSRKSNYNEVDSLLKRITPANLIIDLSLMYNQHKILKPYTHRKLKIYTHRDLREEVLKNE